MRSEVRNLHTNPTAHEGYSLVVGFMTYNDALTRKGLYYLKELFDENKDSLFLLNANNTGGVEVSNRIRYVGIYNSLMSYRGLRIDQLLLIDDVRMMIRAERYNLISTIREYCMTRSFVPEEYQIQEVIW